MGNSNSGLHAVVGSDKIPLPENESELEIKKTKVKKVVANIDFKKELDEEMPNIFAPPKNPKTLQLPVQRTTCNITLPEDCHYKPENLVRLFVLPDVMVNFLIYTVPSHVLTFD